MGGVVLTRELAFASGQDAGNRSLRDGGRTAWSPEDADISTATTNKLLLYVPFDKGGLEGLPLTMSMMSDLGLSREMVLRAGGTIIGDNGGPLLEAKANESRGAA